MKAGGISSQQLPVKKRIRSKMVQKIQKKMDIPDSLAEKNGQSAGEEGGVPGRMNNDESNSIRKVPRRKVQNRKIPRGGKIAVVSDGAVDSIAARMEERTKRGIRLIAHSTGF